MAKIEFKADLKPKIAILLDDRVEITFTTNKSYLRSFETLPEQALEVIVKPYSKKRSLSQNSYLWVLLNELGLKLERSKEDIYKEYIKDYGVFEIMPIKNEAAARFMRNWSKNGIGWICEDLGESKLDGYTKIIAYYGSSTYTSVEMKRLLDAIIVDCEELGISSIPIDDIMNLKNDND